MTQYLLSRSLASLMAFLSLATGAALTVAPSIARAETGGNIDCAPCRLFEVADQGGLAFRNVTAEAPDGDQIVVTADVTVAGTAGKPRTGTVVFTAFMELSEDGTFMDYTDDACTPSLPTRQAGTQACDVISRAVRDAATAATNPTPTIAPPSTPTEGIIMRDGGICTPQMGC